MSDFPSNSSSVLRYIGNSTAGQGYEPMRVAVKQEQQFGTIAYGRSNTYPQQTALAIEGSATATACVKALAEFLAGNSFASEVFGNTVVSLEGYTANDLLYMSVCDLAKFGGFAWLVNYNLLGEIASIEIVPFEQVRLSAPDAEGYVCTAQIWDDWARQSEKLNPSRADIMEVPIFNPATALEEMEACGGLAEYKGQLLYWHEQSGYYPKPPIDSVFDDCIAEAKQSEFLTNFMNNGFSASTIIVNETPSPNAETFRENAEQINLLAGARNAGRVGYLEGSLKVLDVATRQLDKDLEATAKYLRQKVRMAFNMPPILIGEVREGGFPNIDELENSFEFFNGHTRRTRKNVERVFAKVFAYWQIEANPSGDYSILEKQYGGEKGIMETPQIWDLLTLDEKRNFVKGQYPDAIQAAPPKKVGSTDNESANPEQAAAQAQLRGSVGGVQGILQIADNFKRGVINESAAITILEEIFGFSSNVSRQILGMNGTAQPNSL